MRSSDTYQIVEDGYSDCQNERSAVHQQDQQRPSTPPKNGMRVKMLRVPKDADEDKLASSVRVQAASDEEVWQRDAIRRLLPHRRQR